MKMFESVEDAIKHVLASCKEVRDVHEYSRRFSELSESTANERVKEDVALLDRVCSPILDFKTKGSPFIPHGNWSDGGADTCAGRPDRFRSQSVERDSARD